MFMTSMKYFLCVLSEMLEDAKLIDWLVDAELAVWLVDVELVVVAE